MNEKTQAAKLAKHGRYGDNRLLHVSDIELAGLASLVPGGRLPTNPKTGLPEAFFFLPLITSLFGAAAPAAATAAAAAPEFIGAGLSAAALPASTALGTGLAAGAEAGAGALGAAALPTAAEVAAPTLTQAAASMALPQAGLSAPSAALAAPSVTAPSVVTPAGAGAKTASIAPHLMGTTQTATLAPAAKGIGGFLSKGLGSLFEGNSLMKLAPLAMMMRGGGGGGGDDDDDGKGKKLSDHYEGPDPQFPDSNYRPGIDPEFRYFNKGGMVYYHGGGPVYRYAQGGIVDLASAPRQNMMQSQMQPVPVTIAPKQDAAGGGIAQLMQPSPMQAPPAQMDSPYTGNDTSSDQQLIEATVAAIKGEAPNPEPILMAFIQTFGETALQDLIARVQQTAAPKGDGMSDSIPAMIDGNQPAALSSGEYVVPSDAVSHLGNGSSQAGAQALDDMVGRVRAAKTGMPMQPAPVNPAGLMPA